MLADDVAQLPVAHSRLAGLNSLHQSIMRHLDQLLASFINLAGRQRLFNRRGHRWGKCQIAVARATTTRVC